MGPLCTYDNTLVGFEAGWLRSHYIHDDGSLFLTSAGKAKQVIFSVLYIIAVDGVEHIKFKHYPELHRGVSRTFRLKQNKFSEIVNFPLTSDCNSYKVKIGNIGNTDSSQL